VGTCHRFALAAALLLISVVPAMAADANEEWIGRRCLAKSLAVLVYDGSRAIGTAKDLDPIFQVVQIEGSWLSVHGTAITGWVRLDDVVPLDGAVEFFDDLIRREPGNLAAYTARGIVSKERGDYEQAIADHGYVMQHDPKPSAAYLNRGNAWAGKGEHDKALADYAEAIRYDPQFLAAYNNLAWSLATRPERQLRDGPRAVTAATKACELTAWKNAECLDTLAAANAEAGDFPEAEQWEKRALEITHPRANAYRQFSQRLAMYRNHQPYRQVTSSP
jgi:tetratricopeptide (TPR) repeat protein